MRAAQTFDDGITVQIAPQPGCDDTVRRQETISEEAGVPEPINSPRRSRAKRLTVGQAPDVVAELRLPTDLTAEEAERMARFVTALTIAELPDETDQSNMVPSQPTDLTLGQDE